jgi:hypothetical protein
MFPLRVTLTSIQLLIFILVLIGLSVQRIIGYLPLQSLLSDIIGDFHLLVPLLFLYCICEPETVFKRIKRTIPLSFSKRLFLFPFYTGAANAMVWCVLTLFIEGVLLLLFSHENPTDKTNDIVPLLHGCFNFGLLIFNYCATTLLIYHLLLRRWISRSWNWVFPFVFVAVIILFLVFTNWIANRFFSAFINPFALLEQLPLVPNPISAFIVSDSLREMSIEMIWFAVLAVTGFRWLRRHFKAFRQDQE